MVDDFTFHKVSEKEREQIRRDAKKLLEGFAGKLGKIRSGAGSGHFENGLGVRDEGDGWNSDEDFRSIMFGNAPFVEDEFLVAEKGGWKK